MADVGCGLSDEASVKHRRRQSQSGQIILEYVLLLMFAVSIAAVITKAMIGRETGNPGFVIKAWDAMLQEIGKDTADDIKRGN
jgi:hypothetical protein